MENYIEKVTVKFNNTKPVEVIDFLTSISSFKKQYEFIVKQEGFKIDDESIKLYIHVREGCIEWEFIRLLWYSKPIQSTLSFIGNKLLHKTWDKIDKTIDKIKKEEDISNEQINELENIKGCLQPTKNDLSSEMSYTYESNEHKECLTFKIQGAEGRGIYDKFCEIVENKKIPIKDDFEDKILQLIVSSKSNSTATRGIIEDFSEKDYQIIFSKDIKETIENTNNPFIGFYLVNGSVKKAQGKIVLYYITQMEK